LPLQDGTSQETISDNIKETLESPSFGPGKRRKKRHQMAVAAAMSKSRETVSRAAMKKKIR